MRYRSVVTTLAVGFALVSGCSHLASRDRSARPGVVDAGVRFSFYAPHATRVQLAGNWPENNWARGDGSAGEADIGLMADKNSDGVWEIVVQLGPGRYHYLFWVNENTWHLDPANPEEVEGGPARVCSQVVVFTRNGKTEIR